MTARPLLALAAALTTSLLVGTTVSAGPFDESRTVRVSYADLDLTHPDGLTQLERRVETATDRVCASHGTLDLKSRMATRQCRDTALANAMGKVQLAALKASSQQYAAVRRSVGGE